MADSEATDVRVSEPEPLEVGVSLGILSSLSELLSKGDANMVPLSNMEDGLEGIPEVRGRTEARLLRGKAASSREGRGINDDARRGLVDGANGVGSGGERVAAAVDGGGGWGRDTSVV